MEYFLLSKKNKLDQYYTSPDVVSWCWERLAWRYNLHNFEFVEPSAGEGAFLRGDLNIKGYDLEPKHPDVVKQDFLKLDKTFLKGKFVVGNPPFGWASSLALKFINHCSDADVIAFILPRTFSKKLFQEKVDLNLHLVAEWDLPKNSFILEGLPYDVPCCFQIWERKTIARVPLVYKDYIKECQEGGKFLRRVGGRAGKFVSEKDYTPSTTYKVCCSKDVALKVEACYSDILNEASKTAGVRSITINEINYILTQQEDIMEMSNNLTEVDFGVGVNKPIAIINYENKEIIEEFNDALDAAQWLSIAGDIYTLVNRKVDYEGDAEFDKWLEESSIGEGE